MKLTQAELDVMQVLWECEEPIRPSALLHKIHATKPWSISTLKTILVRLDEKGVAQSSFVKRFLYYAPKITKEEYFHRETQKLMSELNPASPVSLLAGLISSGNISQGEIEAIEELLKEAKARFPHK